MADLGSHRLDKFRAPLGTNLSPPCEVDGSPRDPRQLGIDEAVVTENHVHI